jgi:ribose-phosphate pyrophosphokinase
MNNYKCSIIADPESSSWGFAFSIYKILSQKSDKFELNKVIITRFRDGEIKPKIEKNVRERNCFFIHDSNKDPLEWFTELVLINQTLKNSSAQTITDVLPYLKFARQDKKDETRVPISARVIADMISLYTTRAISLDIHNPAIQGFYTIPFDNLYSFPIVVKYLKLKYPEILNNIVVMSPDAGGTQRASSFAKRLGIQDVAIGYKVRNKPGEVNTLKILGNIENKNILIVDDILDSGNTLVKAAVAARELGAKNVYAYCTHGLFTEGTEKLEKEFDLIFISDTIKREETNKIKVISMSSLLAEAIYRTNEGQSLSELFEFDK